MLGEHRRDLYRLRDLELGPRASARVLSKLVALLSKWG
jgi:hypothetical protein